MPDKYRISGPNLIFVSHIVRYLIEKKGSEEGKRLYPDYIKMPDIYRISGPNLIYHATVRYLIEKKGLEEGKRLHPDYIKMLKYLRYFLFFFSFRFGFGFTIGEE